MADPVDAGAADDFAKVFGDALNRYVQSKGIQHIELVALLGLDPKIGKQRISTYCRDGERKTPSAEMLWLACSKLPDFSFSYKGYRISAATLNGNGSKPSSPAEQIPLDFERQFNLTDKQGTIDVRVSRPRGRIEVSLSLKAAS